MNEKLISKTGPIAAIDILPEWIEERRAITLRDGHAMRGSRHFPVIEVQSIRDPNLWTTLNLPTGTPLFVSFADRDQILFKIWGRDALQKTSQ